jgi:hypothetical protein
MHRRRHTRDGTRRRSYSALDVVLGTPGNTGRSNYNWPRSDDDPATQETAAEDAYNDAQTAAAASNVTAYLTAVKAAAEAAALARSGANSTGDGTDAADAASAENWASLALGFSTFGCSVAECRTRGGTATLCGFSEFSSASTPPKKYRVNTISESFYWCTYGSSDCTGNSARFELLMSGAASYNSSTCTLTTIDYSTRNDTGDCGVPSGSYTVTQRSRLVYDPAFMLLDTDTATLREVSARPPCYNFSGGAHVTASGNGSETLSVEDTEADAITRLQASGSWSSWSAAGSTSCLAKYETRTSGFSFAWQEAQFRATISITSGVTGVVKVGVYRRAYGSGGAWTLISTEYFSVTGNGSNEDTISMDVPNEQGYETYVACLAAGS